MFKKVGKRLFDVVVNSKLHFEDEAVFAGRKAEYQTRKMINNKIKGTGWKIYSSIRIPDIFKNMRRELDFIIVSDKDVIAIELKNWSGELEIIDEEFIQYRTHGKGDINHGNILNDLDEKCSALNKYLNNSIGIEQEIKRLLVFYNDSLWLPEILEENINVVTYDQLKEYLPQNSVTNEGIISAILRILGLKIEKTKKTKVSLSTNILKIRNALDNLGTWDTIELFGNKVLFGDIITTGRKCLMMNGNKVTNRSEIYSVDVNIDRNPIGAIYRDPKHSIEIHYRNGNDKKIENIHIEKYVYYQEAGSKIVDRVKLQHLKSIEFGYISKNKNRDWSNMILNSIYEGKIKKIADYGMLVDIGGPRWGLLHNSKLKKNTNISIFNIGDKIQTKLVYKNEKQNKLSLAMV
jgi:hypothetical protein